MPQGLIGVSAAEQARFTAFYASLTGLNRPDNTINMFSTSSNIAENRNKITTEALRLGVDWVLYLDDDQILQPDTLDRLLAADKDIISAHYCQRQSPFNPVLMQQYANGNHSWKQLEPTDRGIVSIEAAGAGCLLVKRKVLEALQPPYWTLGQINPASWGDDLDFCLRVRQAGFTIYCDLENSIGHIMSGFVFPLFDKQTGWTAHMVQSSKGVIATWPMPMFGDTIS